MLGTSAAYTVLAAAGASTASAPVGDYIAMTTQVRYIGSSAASDLTLEWKGVNFNGPSLVDTTAFAEVLMTGTNSASVKQSYTHFIGSLDGIAITVTNNENVDAASVWISTMFGTG